MKKALLIVPLLACSSPDSSTAPSASASSSSATIVVSAAPSAAATPSASASAESASVAPLETQKRFLLATKSRFDALGVSKLVMHTPETDPNKLMGRPGQYVGKITWSVRGEDATLEVFETLPAALARAEYVRKIGEKSPLLLQWVFVNEDRYAVLRLGHKVPPAEAKEWERITAGLSSAP